MMNFEDDERARTYTYNIRPTSFERIMELITIRIVVAVVGFFSLVAPRKFLLLD